MKIYYQNSTGKIIAANYDRDDFTWANSINMAHTVLTIDELDTNKALCLDISRHAVKGKYYIAGGELYQVENWTPPVEDIWPM